MAIKRNGIVPDDIATYAAEHSTGLDEVQQHLVETTAEATGAFAGMQIGGDQGMFMEILTRATGARNAVEIGTFTGYSSLSIARGLPAGGRLLCCDVSEEWTAIAREHWEQAGVADRIELRLAPALDTLAGLDPATRFDLAFIDADKVNYAAYLDALVPLLRPGALVLVDNTLWSGRVLRGEGEGDTDTAAIRAFNDSVAADDRFRVVMLTIGDGVTLLERR
jgi:caffeoyl-CoA O-methyltransferase